MKRIDKAKCILPLIGLLNLIACGGSGDKNGASSSDESTTLLSSVRAFDTFSIVKPGQETAIDLTQSTENARSVSVSAETVGCGDPQLDGFRFTVQYDNGGYCHYNYQAKDEHGHIETATIALLATNADEPVLPALSRTLDVTESNIHHFNLKELLKGVWKDSYVLNDNIQVVGQFGNSIATSHGETISYQAIDEPSWNTITYTLIDSLNPDEQYIGRIYTALANNSANSPDISNEKYDHFAETATAVPTIQDFVVDLTALPNLAITHAEDWQLIHVESLTADVEMTDAESVTNKSFNFSTQSVGQHIVSYIVADHYSNYSAGLIAFNVIANESAKTWTDLKVVSNSFNATYSAPALYSEVASNFNVLAYWDQEVENTVAGFTSEQGKLYCSEFGSVPLLSEIRTLRERGMLDALDSGDFSALPKQLNYLAIDKQNFSFVKYDLTTGVVGQIIGNEPLYLTCVKSDYLSIDTLISSAVADNFDYHAVTVNKAANEAITVNVIAEATESFTDADVSTRVTPIDPATDLIKVSSIKSGSFRLEIAGANDTLTTPKITFVADRSSANFEQLNWSRADDHQSNGLPYLVANSTDSNTLTVNVIDANFNAIQDEPIEISIADAHVSTSLNLADRFTDNNGELAIPIMATPAAISEGDFDKVVTLSVQVGSDTQTLSIQLRTEAYLEYIDVTEVVTNHRYTSARIFVRDADGNALNRTLNITGGQPGSIIQLEDTDGYQGSFTVPVEGTRIYLSMIQDNVQGNFMLSMSGSPSQPIVTIPAATRVKRCVGLPQIYEGGTTLPDDWIQPFLEGYDTMVIRRTAAAQIGTVTLPSTLLTGFAQENVGKVIMVKNLTSSEMTVRQHYNNNQFVSSPVSAHSYRYFYFDGDMWAGVTNLFNPGDFYEQWCN